MNKEVKIPKYVLKLLEKRRQTAQKFHEASYAVDNYCEKIGINLDSDLFEDACLLTDVRILGEGDSAYNLTLKAIEEQLRRNNNECR